MGIEISVRDSCTYHIAPAASNRERAVDRSTSPARPVSRGDMSRTYYASTYARAYVRPWVRVRSPPLARTRHACVQLSPVDHKPLGAVV